MRQSFPTEPGTVGNGTVNRQVQLWPGVSVLQLLAELASLVLHQGIAVTTTFEYARFDPPGAIGRFNWTSANRQAPPAPDALYQSVVPLVATVQPRPRPRQRIWAGRYGSHSRAGSNSRFSQARPPRHVKTRW